MNRKAGARAMRLQTRAPIRRLVIKIGSSLITRDGGRLDVRLMARLVRQLAAFRQRKIEIILVSSGAIAAGMGELRWLRRPLELAKKASRGGRGTASPDGNLSPAFSAARLKRCPGAVDQRRF